MSWRVSNACAERKFGSATRKQIIMILANKASDDGSGIWCSKGTIQRHTELGETTVKRTVREFLKEGILVETGARGGAGNDVLHGGGGSDLLWGGSGQDDLFAANDNATDVFVFTDPSESTVEQRGSDRIFQFEGGKDLINLRALDADINQAGDQAFSFGRGANSVWVVDNGSDLIVRSDVDGDGRSDSAIQLVNIDSLVAGDFLL